LTFTVADGDDNYDRFTDYCYQLSFTVLTWEIIVKRYRVPAVPHGLAATLANRCWI